MGENRDAVFGLLIVIAIIAIIAVVVMTLTNSGETKTSDTEVKESVKEKTAAQDVTSKETKLDTEDKVLDFIGKYKGKDNAGMTLEQTVVTIMNVAYPGEDILASPSTTGYYVATPDHSREISDRYLKVQFEVQTYRETAHFDWIVDTETNSVYAGNEEGKSILIVLDNFDK